MRRLLRAFFAHLRENTENSGGGDFFLLQPGHLGFLGIAQLPEKTYNGLIPQGNYL